MGMKNLFTLNHLGKNNMSKPECKHEWTSDYYNEYCAKCGTGRPGGGPDAWRKTKTEVELKYRNKDVEADRDDFPNKDHMAKISSVTMDDWVRKALPNALIDVGEMIKQYSNQGYSSCKYTLPPYVKDDLDPDEKNSELLKELEKELEKRKYTVITKFNTDYRVVALKIIWK